MLLIAVPGLVRNSKWSGGLEHKCYSTLGYLHLGWYLLRCSLKFLVGNAMGNYAALKGYTAWLKLVRPSAILAVYEPHKLRGNVSVVVRGSVGV